MTIDEVMEEWNNGTIRRQQEQVNAVLEFAARSLEAPNAPGKYSFTLTMARQEDPSRSPLRDCLSGCRHRRGSDPR